jgi:preprotein translocase subunit SecG
MNVLMTILQAVQILAAIGMIGLILMQHGKGADAGAAFGGGAGSASLFGATGGANFLSRTTAVLAGVFLASTLALAYFSNAVPAAANSGSVLENTVPASDIPAGSAAPAATPASPVDAPAAPVNGGAQIPGK